MNIYAISDLHLPGGTNKTMDRFGPQWHNHAVNIAAAWDETVTAEDLVLLPGDFSWAMQLDGMQGDIDWLAQRPGQKVLVRGNHDYWWAGRAKLAAALPDGIECIQNDAVYINDIALAGCRYWDDPVIDWPVMDAQDTARPDEQEQSRYLERELGRLRLSLEQLSDSARLRIALLHYPPISPNGTAGEAAALLEEFNIDICVFGHIHGWQGSIEPIYVNSITYHLVSADAVGFAPVLICKGD